MKVSKKLVLSALTAMTAFVLVACGNSGQNPSNQAAQSQASSSVSQSSETVSSNSKASSNTNSSANTSSSETSASSQTAASDLDGTYKATHEGDTLTKVERDGEQEIEQVQVDPTNQTMIVGDDVKRYRVEGKQLTLEDLSQENDDDDIIVFTKQ